MRLALSLLGGLFFWTALAQPSLAREEPLESYAVLDTWLRAEQFNERCRVLNYFEVQRVKRGINASASVTPEGNDVKVMAGTAFRDEVVAKRDDMVKAHRATAREAVANQDCSQGDDVKVLRIFYIREYVKSLLASQSSPDLQKDTAGRKNAAQSLFSFSKGMYGAKFAPLIQEVSAELQTEGFDADKAWDGLNDTVNDLQWQLRLGEKGYGFHPLPNGNATYEAVKLDGSGARFPAKLSERDDPSFMNSEGWPVSVNRVDGITDDGRMVTLVSMDTAEAGKQALQAQLFVQKDADVQAWSKPDWRSKSLSFMADVETGADCPADFCFTFPQEASDAVRERQGAGNAADYKFELVIAEPEQFPLPETKESNTRRRFHPMNLN